MPVSIVKQRRGEFNGTGEIFEDGKEIHYNDSDLLVLAGFKEAGGATETNFGVVGTRANKMAIINALSETVSTAIEKISDSEVEQSMLLLSFLSKFKEKIGV